MFSSAPTAGSTAGLMLRPKPPRRRETDGPARNGEAMKPVSQVSELVDGHAEVAIELAEHLPCSLAQRVAAGETAR